MVLPAVPVRISVAVARLTAAELLAYASVVVPGVHPARNETVPTSASPVTPVEPNFTATLLVRAPPPNAITLLSKALPVALVRRYSARPLAYTRSA